MVAKLRKLEALVGILLFAAAILLPAVGLLRPLDPTKPLDEKRVLASLPDRPASIADFIAFPAKFEAYFNDHFGFRNLLIKSYYIAKVAYLASQPTPVEGSSKRSEAPRYPRAIVGSNGMLYFGGDFVPESRRGVFPLFTQSELNGISRQIRERRDFLRARNIRYAIVLMRDKESILTDDLPRFLRAPNVSRRRIDQLIELFSSIEGIEFIDATALQRENAANEAVWYKTNTHMNGIGDFHVAREVLRRLRELYPAIRVPERGDYELSVKPLGWAHDLAGMIGMHDYYQEPEIKLLPKAPWRSVEGRAPDITSSKEKFREQFSFSTGDTRLPRAILFHNSFGRNLLPFLRDQFEQLDCYWTESFYSEPVTKMKPNIVIQQYIERLIVYAPWPDRTF